MANASVSIAKLAVAYRRLVLWVGAQLAISVGGGIVLAFVLGTPLQAPVALLRLLGLLVTIVALVIYAYRTATALGSPVSLLWAIAMFVPLVNLITLLVLSSKSTKACRAAGVPVGFFGPKDIDGVLAEQIETFK